jgi:cyclopropane-fatty-acyl-phospholipid synthase
MPPSGRQISAAAEKLLVLEDWHSFGPDYDPAPMVWHRNFVASWDQIKVNYDHRFYRMWTYYLLTCAGAFRARRNQLWQIVFSKNGVLQGMSASVSGMQCLWARGAESRHEVCNHL